MTTTDHLARLAISCYYAGELDAGRRACDRLLRTPDLPESLEHQVRGNRVWYTEPIRWWSDLRRIEIEPAAPGWTLFNPTLFVHGDETFAIVRSSNYRLEGGRYVIPPEDGNRIRTENILCRVAGDLTLSDPRVLQCEPFQVTDYPVEGYEDVRVLEAEEGLAISATCRNAAGFDGRCRIATATLDVDAATVGLPLLIDGLQCSHHEKNWMPIGGMQSTWLHSCWSDGYTTTVDPDPTMPGGWRVCRRGKAPPVARGFRGGSQLVPIAGKGWLAVIHEVAAFGNHRAYEHRFVAFDRDLCISAVSPAFAFRESRTVEFAAGMVLLGDDLVISFGVKDAEAYLCRVPVTEVLSWLVSAW